MLEGRLGYDPITECQLQANADPAMFARTQAAEFSSPALEASRNFAATIADLQTFANFTADVLAVISPKSTQPSSKNTQARMRDALLLHVPSGGKALVVIAFDKSVMLKTIPDDKAANILSLDPATPLRLNCDTTICTDHWAAVTANINNKAFRGWVPRSQLIPALELRYNDGALYPTKSDLTALRLKLKPAPGGAPAPIKLTAVQLKGSTALAESRLIRLKNSVVDLGVPEDKISLEIHEVERLDGAPFIELKVASLIPNALPLAYQPFSGVR
jgi:hypothetical protein